MPRPIRSIEIYLPLDYNDGQPIEESKFVHLEQLKARLMKKFDQLDVLITVQELLAV